MKTTHTYSVLEVEPRTYREIRNALSEAGWTQAIHDDREGELVDLHGVAIRARARPLESSGSWGAFREAGLLWFVNRLLHVFGWAIVVKLDEDGDTVEAGPERVRYRGFTEEDEDEGFRAVADYLADNAEELAGELEAETVIDCSEDDPELDLVDEAPTPVPKALPRAWEIDLDGGKAVCPTCRARCIASRCARCGQEIAPDRSGG